MRFLKYPLLSKIVYCLTLILTCAIVSGPTFAQKQSSENSIAIVDTNLGEIHIELFDQLTPKTVENFKSYVNSGFYSNTIFHRVIRNFMIQGGGFDSNMTRKATLSPIKNESQVKLSNKKGTIAMARTSDPHSATSQFFINVVDNPNLDKSFSNPGYAVFGQIVKGMDVAEKISFTPTTTKNYMRDVPATPVIIESVSLVSPNTK